MKQKNRFELIILGRGGQGAKTAAELLAYAASLEGKFIQAFPEFGPERSGAPVKAFLRISDSAIKTHEPVVNPDCIIVLDDSLLNLLEDREDSREQVLIINSKKTEEELKRRINFKGNLISVDASGMAMEIIGENRPNSVILGKFVFVTEMVSLESVKKAFRDKYLAKIGHEKTNLNLLAIEKAYDIF